MADRRTLNLLLAAVFLFLLGTGNLAIGVFKAAQYEDVLKELANESPGVLVNASPIKRIQASEQMASRAYQQNKRAMERVDFYRFVAFGGKLLMGVSVVLLLCSGAVFRVRNQL